MPEDESPKVQATVETPRVRPQTDDPFWHLLFDRLDGQDDNIKRIGDNTVIIATEQERLRQHVNDERDDMMRLINQKVTAGTLLADLVKEVRVSHSAQAVIAVVLVSLTPLIILHWQEVWESVRALF